jgi:hypothetical protein
VRNPQAPTAEEPTGTNQKFSITKAEFKSVHPVAPSLGPYQRKDYSFALSAIGATVALYSGYSRSKYRAVEPWHTVCQVWAWRNRVNTFELSLRMCKEVGPAAVSRLSRPTNRGEALAEELEKPRRHFGAIWRDHLSRTMSRTRTRNTPTRGTHAFESLDTTSAPFRDLLRFGRDRHLARAPALVTTRQISVETN